MDQVKNYFLDVSGLFDSNDDVVPMISSIVKLSAERGMRFDTNNHFISRLFKFHVISLLLKLSKFIWYFLHLFGKRFGIIIFFLKLLIIFTLHILFRFIIMIVIIEHYLENVIYLEEILFFLLFWVYVWGFWDFLFFGVFAFFGNFWL